MSPTDSSPKFFRLAAGPWARAFGTHGECLRHSQPCYMLRPRYMKKQAWTSSVFSRVFGCCPREPPPEKKTWCSSPERTEKMGGSSFLTSRTVKREREWESGIRNSVKPGIRESRPAQNGSFSAILICCAQHKTGDSRPQKLVVRGPRLCRIFILIH